MNPVPARYFDGKVAAEKTVTATLDAHGLTITGLPSGALRWSLSSLRAVDQPVEGLPLRLASESETGARLIIANDAFAAQLLALAPHLKGGLNGQNLKRFALVALASLASVALLAYLILVVAPRQVAFSMPESWRQTLGAQIERSFTKGRKICDTLAGRAAIDKLTQRIREGNPELPPFTLTVYDTPIINAFALPGGRIAIFSNLISTADTPEEVAGVLAHEIGHVANRHSEAQLVRAIGLQLLLSLASGGTGGDQLGELASVLAILQYSRDAEREADDYAQNTLSNAAIDPLGLRRFFEKIKKLEGDGPGIFGDLGDLVSTHPLTDDRIAAIKPLEGKPRPVLSPEEWNVLQKICG